MDCRIKSGNDEEKRLDLKRDDSALQVERPITASRFYACTWGLAGVTLARP